VAGQRRGLGTLDLLQPQHVIAGELAERQTGLLRVGRLGSVLGDDLAGAVVRAGDVEAAVARAPAPRLAGGRDPRRADAALDLTGAGAKHDLVEDPRALRTEL
jgi:hypothetical protein